MKLGKSKEDSPKTQKDKNPVTCESCSTFKHSPPMRVEAPLYTPCERLCRTTNKEVDLKDKACSHYSHEYIFLCFNWGFWIRDIQCAHRFRHREALGLISESGKEIRSCNKCTTGKRMKKRLPKTKKVLK